ncbi:MAG: hypothetical protein H6513_05220 [Acidimicrobiaceae bacterium]|nr:hypothetical protein [Ilumatobacter sp.]MCB9380074.1 hypothetical protein [Acidimicrobiaceae bacterium]MCO5330252.1 hypothetical protein [Ilumatobacteraceae bacterium]
MGLFKDMKDMKNAVAAAPGMVDQAQQMAANAQAMQAQMMAQQQAAMQQVPMANPSMAAPGGNLEPIAGVDLTTYARIVKAIAPLNYDQSALPGIAATHGIDGASWQAAHDGWNARIQGDPGVARAFSDVYRTV